MPVYRYQFSGAPDSLVNLGQYLPAVPTAAATGPALFVDITVAAIAKDDLDGLMASKGYSFVIQDPVNSPEEASAAATLSRLNLYNAGVLLAKRAGVNLTGSAVFADDAPNDRVSFNAAAVSNIAGWNPNTIPTPGVSPYAARADHTHRSEMVQSAMFDQAVNLSTTSTTFVNLLTGSVLVQPGAVLLINASGSLSNSVSGATMATRLVVDGVPFRGAGVRPIVAGSAASFEFAFRVAGLGAGARNVAVQWKTNVGTARCRPALAPDTEHCTIVVQEVRA
jgi:hypothetical protein